jgi:hypothetical protein
MNGKGGGRFLAVGARVAPGPCVCIMAVVMLALTAPALAQFKTGDTPPRQPPPPPERVYPGAADRTLSPPEFLRDAGMDPDFGVQIGLGPHAVAAHVPTLNLDDTPGAVVSEGVVISADVLLGSFRLGYSRQFYRRNLPAGTSYKGEPANFLSVDGDQFVATAGWRPWHWLYLGMIGGGVYRLIHIRQDSGSLLTKTETAAVFGVLANLQVASPFGLELRLLREAPHRIVRLDSTILQLTYFIPF